MAEESPLLLPEPVQAAGHHFWFFLDTTAMLRSLARDLAQAKSRAYVETYIFADDALTAPIAGALADRARAGIDVRVIYDAFGSMTTPQAFFDALLQAGAMVHAHHSLFEALRGLSPLWILNHRDHKKLVVIDDEWAYFGGMNLLDTRPSRRDAKNTSESGWRDLHVRMSGPQVARVAESFMGSWRRAKKLPAERPSRLNFPSKLWHVPGEALRFVDSRPGLRFTRANRVFRRLLSRAQNEMWIVMAYFLPPWGIWRAIIRSRRRGCKVQVVVPRESDVRLVRWACRYMYRKLLRNNILVFERRGQMLHTKAVVVDREWTVLGSPNLDTRSLFLNYEFLAIVRSRTFADAVRAICQEEIAASDRITTEDYPRLSLLQRFLDRVAYFFRSWL